MIEARNGEKVSAWRGCGRRGSRDGPRFARDVVDERKAGGRFHDERLLAIRADAPTLMPGGDPVRAIT
jgi:hypothetical protein